MTANITTTFNTQSTPTKISIAPVSATVVTGNTQVFTAIVCDQLETGPCDAGSNHKIPGQAVDWSVTGGGTPLTQNGTASYTFTATTPGTGFTLTASHSGVSLLNQGTAAPIAINGRRSLILSGSSWLAAIKGGTLTIVGHDNVARHNSQQLRSAEHHHAADPHQRRWCSKHYCRRLPCGGNLYADR